MQPKQLAERIKQLEARLNALKQKVKTYSEDIHQLKQRTSQLYEADVKTADAEKIKNLRKNLTKNTR